MKTIIDFANKVKSLADGRMSNIANVEESPSTHAYTVGKQLIFNGLLCKVTSAIAVGDTLAVGTNLALSDNVVEQIYSLNQGLTNSLNEIADMNNVLGAKNLLPNNATNQTVNGVTFTVNDDGSITANGTASANTGFTIALDIDARGMILSGCPAGGSRSTYSLQYTNYVDESFADEGNGITIPLSTNTGLWRVVIWITAQSVVNNLVFKPMIRPASIKDDTYVPYSMTNRELSDNIADLASILLNGNMHFQIAQMSINQSPFVVTRQAGESDIIFAFRGNQTYLFTADKWGSTGTIFASGSEVSVRASSAIGTTSDMTISNSSSSAFIFFIIKIKV